MKLVALLELDKGELKWNKKIAILRKIRKIKKEKLSEGFNKIYSGDFQNQLFYFGTYKNTRFVLGGIFTRYKQNINNIFPNKKQKGILIKLAGRLKGVNKANSVSVKFGKLRTQSINSQLQFASKPVQTKWGKFGLKVYLG